MPKILFISRFFPPEANVSSLRPVKFAKYLQRLGWDVAVLTQKHEKIYPVDNSLMKNIPSGAKVYRLSAYHPREFFGSLNRLGLKWLSEFIKDFFLFSDEEFLWTLYAYIKARKILIRESPDIVFVSCVRPLHAVIGYVLKRTAAVPVVLDFHNEWTKGIYYKPPTLLHHRLNLLLEAKVINAVDRVITLNPFHTDDLQKRFGDSGKFITIENGYDEEDFGEITPPEKSKDKLVFTYTGAIYGYQKPTPFLDVIERLVKDGSIDAGSVEINIIGDIFTEFGEAGKYSFKVNLIKRIPHADLGKYLAQADIFFLYLKYEAERQRPAKIYEYMYFKKPVLCIAPHNGAAGDLVRSTNCGIVIPPDDIQKLKQVILEYYRIWKNKNKIPQTNPVLPEQYNRRELAIKLDAILRKLIE
jgi:glycosyltransferase involved in cell wall biosynthesis